mgnify:CR=1 FL=1
MTPNRQAPSPAFALVNKWKVDGTLKSAWEGDLLPDRWSGWRLVVHRPGRHLKFTQTDVAETRPLFVHCFGLIRPLTVLLQYSPDGSFQEAKCDAALPATLAGRKIDFVDLDLDVIVAADLSYYVRDEDVFARNAEQMGYGETAVAQARAGIALAQALVSSRRFPFDDLLVPRINLVW